MVIDVDLQDLFLSLNIDEERQKRIDTRKKQIEYEFSLYRCFCKLFGLHPCKLDSYTIFKTYCDINHINLL